MKTKKLLIWVAALVVVVLLVVISEQISNRAPSAKEIAFFPGLSEDKLGAVLIADQDDTVTIRKRGDVWIAYEVGPQKDSSDTSSSRPLSLASIPEPAGKEYPSDSASVQSIIEKLQGMKKNQLISENPEKQEMFEVDTANGMLVALWDNAGSLLGSFRIGKNGPSWSSHYVRMVASNKVYSVGGSIKYAFFTDIDRWKDKTIIKFDRSLAQKVTLAKKSGDLIVLEKTTDSLNAVVWNIVQPIRHTAKTDEVNAIIDELSALKASEWEEDTTLTDSAMGFIKPELVAQVMLDGGRTREISIGASKGDAKKFWVKSKDKEPVYLVADWTINKLDKGVDDLKAEEPDSTKAE